MKTIKRMLAATLAATIIISGSMTAFAATAQDITAKNTTNYTAGTQSVYGPKLTQDQLNAVANVVANFKTNHTTDTMTNDQKIRAGYDYIKNRVSYIDWDKGVAANTAYALVTGQGACSGMTRGFIALMDSVDVKAYLIHANTNDHQWIMTEFDNGFAYIDIDANMSAGFEAIYNSKTHPYTYDTNGFPAVGSHSAEYGAKTTAAVTEGWKQDTTGWWYQNADGSYPVNTWKEINGKHYYFGGNGYMLANTTTPDGYQVGSDGAWVQQGQQVATNGMRAWMDGAKNGFGYHQEGYPLYHSENRLGI